MGSKGHSRVTSNKICPDRDQTSNSTTRTSTLRSGRPRELLTHWSLNMRFQRSQAALWELDTLSEAPPSHKCQPSLDVLLISLLILKVLSLNSYMRFRNNRDKRSWVTSRNCLTSRIISPGIRDPVSLKILLHPRNKWSILINNRSQMINHLRYTMQSLHKWNKHSQIQ